MEPTKNFLTTSNAQIGFGVAIGFLVYFMFVKKFADKYI